MTERMHASRMAMSKKDWAELHAKELTIVRANWDGMSGDVVAVVWDDDDTEEMAIARRFAASEELLEFVRRHAKRNPIYAKGFEKDVIREAIELVAKAEGRSS